MKLLNSMPGRTLLLGAVCLLSCLMQGCMVGGTRGTGLGYNGYSEGSPVLLHVRILGSIKNISGKKYTGIQVAAHTKNGVVSTSSDSAGNFVVDLAFESGESVTFIFESKELKGSVATELSPEGREAIPLRFIVQRNGELQVSK